MVVRFKQTMLGRSVYTSWLHIVGASLESDTVMCQLCVGVLVYASLDTGIDGEHAWSASEAQLASHSSTASM